MFNLNKTEKIVIVFLVLTAFLGVGASYYKKNNHRVNLKVENSELGKSNINIDALINKEKFININKADYSKFTQLPGIGPTLAQRIIIYRNSNGPFKKIDDIAKVNGIGPKKFDNIKEFLII